MHAELQALIDELESARQRLHRLAGTVTGEQWAQRPATGGWSAAECVAHLNLTSQDYVPTVRQALARGRAMGGAAPARYRRDLVGWLLCKGMKPGGSMKVKTTPSFVPKATAPAAELVAEFDRLQNEQISLIRQADGLPLGRLKIPSPFNAWVKYNLYSMFNILAVHQHRHLLQAERAAGQR